MLETQEGREDWQVISYDKEKWKEVVLVVKILNEL